MKMKMNKARQPDPRSAASLVEAGGRRRNDVIVVDHHNGGHISPLQTGHHPHQSITFPSQTLPLTLSSRRRYIGKNKKKDNVNSPDIYQDTQLLFSSTRNAIDRHSIMFLLQDNPSQLIGPRPLSPGVLRPKYHPSSNKSTPPNTIEHKPSSQICHTEKHCACLAKPPLVTRDAQT